MLTLILVVLFFLLLIGIFVRLGNRGTKRTPTTSTSCRSYIDPRATVCPQCSHDIDRAAVNRQLKVANYKRLALSVALVAGFFYIYLNMPAPAEPLPVPQQQGGSCPSGYLSSGSYCVPSSSRQDAVVKPPSGTCPNGWLSSGSYCLRSGSRNQSDY
jgi:hypothetical protein